MEEYDTFDLAKLLMSLLVCVLHGRLLFDYIFPWVNLAVPMFLMISSFLMYSKINKTPEKRNEIVKKQIIRFVRFHLFWTLVFLPIIIYQRMYWFADGIIYGLFVAGKNILFHSTFTGSWYIMATIWSILIIELIYRFNKKHCYIISLIISIIAFFACCLRSSYSFLIENNSLIETVNSYYDLFFSSPVLSFPNAMIFVSFGMIFADKKDNQKINGFFCKNRFALAIVSLALLCLEHLFIERRSGEIYTEGVYLSLIPSSIALFFILKEKKLTLSNHKKMRAMSSIIYAMHGSLLFLFSNIAEAFRLKWYNSHIQLLIVITICCLTSVVILKLENRFPILKNSH